MENIKHPRMNATLFDGGKVHRLNGLVARCGVGKQRRRNAWQMDLGTVTCQRCTKCDQADEIAKKLLATDKHGWTRI
jgi:hypothetical protein